MSRRRKALHRSILPDPRYKSTLVTELVGVVLKQGKKTIAEQIVYTALENLGQKLEGPETPLEKFELCLENIKPRLEVKSRRIGGANYQVPMEVAPDRATLLQNSLPPRTVKATLSARRTTRTRWPKPTRLSHTSVSNSCISTELS